MHRGERHHGGCGRRRGTPSREELVERLQARREQVQQELANIDELLQRLGDAQS